MAVVFQQLKDGMLKRSGLKAGRIIPDDGRDPLSAFICMEQAREYLLLAVENGIVTSDDATRIEQEMRTEGYVADWQTFFDTLAGSANMETDMGDLTFTMHGDCELPIPHGILISNDGKKRTVITSLIDGFEEIQTLRAREVCSDEQGLFLMHQMVHGDLDTTPKKFKERYAALEQKPKCSERRLIILEMLVLL